MRRVAALVSLLTMSPVACEAGDPSEAAPGPACLRSLSTLVGDDPLAYSVAWSPISDHALGGTEHELRLLAIEDEGRGLRVADRYVGEHTHMAVAWAADWPAGAARRQDRGAVGADQHRQDPFRDGTIARPSDRDDRLPAPPARAGEL